MSKKEEFYVGYLERGKTTNSFLKKVLLALGAVVIVGGVLFALGQEKFKNGTFELGTITEIEGVLHEMPYPILRVPTAEGVTKDVLLLGFGKLGPEKTLEEIADGKDLNGMSLKLKGTLIYAEGHTVFQMEPAKEGNFELLGASNEKLDRVSLGEATLQGEIIDPKCYFGVMKPGRGKIHRSCAIRCISGGMPPVFLTTDEAGNSDYFLMTDREGRAINEEVLAFVGKPSSVKGEIIELGDWRQIKVDSEQIVELNTPSTVY